MPTHLDKPVSRRTDKRISGRDVIVTIAPMRGQAGAVFYFRLASKQTSYPLSLSDAYRTAALLYGQKLAAAKRQARKLGIPWARTKHDFRKTMSPPKYQKENLS